MATLTFEITTPERTVFRAEVEQVTIPTTSGQITVLPNHIPLVSELASGELVARQGNDEVVMAVTGGFAEMRSGNELVILADAAERAEEIDIARAEAARERAKQAMEGIREDSEHYIAAAAELQRSLIRLKVAGRKRYRGKHGVGSEGILGDT
ncbi:MAG: F0F1 ATP synthase subunit epsilon [Patescibacteria group bacterium]|jgi:F-type H+-transporting ATPase subunit epsilon